MAAGANLGTSLMLGDLIKVLLIGNIILSTYVGILCWIAAKTGLNTILLARYTLGKVGVKMDEYHIRWDTDILVRISRQPIWVKFSLLV